MKPFNILIVDDVKDVHHVTDIISRSKDFDGYELNLLHTESAKETIELLQQRNDIDLILLDIIMETIHSGLSVIDYVRNELHNEDIQIVISTAYPGNIPDEYLPLVKGANHFVYKVDLTFEKFKSIVIHAIRASKK